MLNYVALRHTRLAAGMTQIDVAIRIGRSRGWYSQVEQGVRRVSNRDAQLIARALGVPLCSLCAHQREYVLFTDISIIDENGTCESDSS